MKKPEEKNLSNKPWHQTYQQLKLRPRQQQSDFMLNLLVALGSFGFFIIILVFIFLSV